MMSFRVEKRIERGIFPKRQALLLPSFFQMRKLRHRAVRDLSMFISYKWYSQDLNPDLSDQSLCPYPLS